MRAWSFYTSQQRNAYAGHEGYDDQLRNHYSYDSRVPNHLGPSVGDLVVLRDETGPLGIGFLEDIETAAGRKRYRRCPTCGTSQLHSRSTLRPTYRCTNGHLFETPSETEAEVVTYRAKYARSFRPFSGLGPDQIETLCIARSRQNAIRELHLDHTLAVLREYGVLPAFVASSA